MTNKREFDAKKWHYVMNTFEIAAAKYMKTYLEFNTLDTQKITDKKNLTLEALKNNMIHCQVEFENYFNQTMSNSDPYQ